MSYTNDERRAAVQELVQGTLSFPASRLGTRDLGASYLEVSELVNSLLLFDPDTVFYLIYLTAKRLRTSLAAEITICDSFLAAVDDLAQPNRPVPDVSSLASARQSLLAMDHAASRRGKVGGPEYQRYRAAMGRMRSQLRRVVRMDYVPRGATTSTRDIVRASSDAKGATAGYFRQLVAQHDVVLERAAWLRTAFSEFQAGKLHSAVSQRQLARAADQLYDMYDLLEPLTPQERTAEARDVLLRLLSNESVVGMLAEGARPGDARMAQEPAAAPTYRVVAYGTGDAPSATGAVCAPFPLYDALAGSPTNVLGFSSLNGAPVSVDLFPGAASSIPGIQAAELVGGSEGDFSVSDDLAVPYPLVSAVGPFDTAANGATFHIIVEGVAYEKTLPANPVTTDLMAAALLNAAAGWVPTQPPVTFTANLGTVVVTHTGAPPLRYRDRKMQVTLGFDYIQDMWPWTVDPGTGPVVASSSAGWDANDKLWIKPNDMPTYVEVDLPLGVWPTYYVTAAAVAAAITGAAVVAGENFEGDVDPPGGNRVVVRSTDDGEGSIITIQSDGTRQPPDARAGIGTPSLLGAVTLGFAVGQESRESDVDIRSVMNVLNTNSTFSAQAAARSVREEYLDERNAVWTAASEISVDLAADPTASWPAFGELKVEIRNGSNRGVYGLTGAPSYVGSTLSLSLDRRLRDPSATLAHMVVVYREQLQIVSLDDSLTSAIQVANPADTAHVVLGFDTVMRRGTVDQVQVQENDALYGWTGLDVSSKFVRVGDQLLDGVGSYQSSVSGVADLSDGVLSVNPGVATTFSLTTGGFILRALPHVRYLEIAAALETWLTTTLLPYEEGLRRIDKVLAPLLLSNPTKDRVDAVYALVEGLKTRLTSLSTALGTITLSRMASAEAALQTMLEQGYDRARTLVLDGRYTAFFDLTANSASYSREFQRAVNELAVEDFNESSRARGRFDADFVRQSQSWKDDTHPDYDFSDMEDEFPDSPVIDYYGGVEGGAG